MDAEKSEFERARSTSLKWRRTGAAPEWETQLGERTIHVKMNDFPEEPMYTLTIDGASLDFNQKPAGWEFDDRIP